MRSFTICIVNQQDIPAVLSEALANMGSLQAPREKWASLLDALGVNLWYSYHKDAPKMTARSAAKAIIASQEGEQAVIIGEGAMEITLRTPGNVEINIQAAVGSIRLSFDFGRDSTYLATLVLADMFRRVPVAALLLAEVAAEAAEKVRSQ